MLSLESSLWSQLTISNGSASQIPELIANAGLVPSSNVVSHEDIQVELFDLLCHQWSTYESTIAAVPHLIHLVSKMESSSLVRRRYISMISWFTGCIRLNKTSATDALMESFESSLQILRVQIVESLPSAPSGAPGSSGTLENMLACYGIASGLTEFGMSVWRLCESTACPSCGASFSFFTSSINPFWKR